MKRMYGSRPRMARSVHHHVVVGALGMALIVFALVPPCWAGSYTLAVTAEHGSVIVTPSKASYNEGDKVVLIPRPDVGYCFESWSGDISSVRGMESITMDRNKSVTATFETWVPPIGTPAPPFGIFETYRCYDNPGVRNPALTYTRNAEGGYYTHYVDWTDPNATDTSNPYGSVAKPRRTVPSTSSTALPAGSVVEIHGGPYTKNSHPYPTYQLYWRASGTAAQPVFIRALHRGDVRFDQMTSMLLGGSYLVVENFDCNDSRLRGHYTLDSDHIAVRNNEMWGGLVTKSEVIYVAQGSFWTVYDNYIHNCGDPYGVEENDWVGVQAGDYSSKTLKHATDVWVMDNYIHDIGSDAIQLNSGAARDLNDVPRRIYIGRNVAHTCGENAVDLKQCADVVYTQNCARNFGGWGSGSDGTAIVINDDAPHENIWVIYNEIYDSLCGIRAQQPAHIIGNIIYNIMHDPNDAFDPDATWPGGGYAIECWGNFDLDIMCNTIYRADCGIMIPSGTTMTLNIADNIISNLNQDSYYVAVRPADVAATATFQNCITYRPSGTGRILWGRSVGETLAGMQSRTGKGQNCLAVDPAFVNADNGNFHSSAGSRAIDAGLSSGVVKALFDEFETRYGISIAKDIEGRSRPQGGEWDIGAHEYAGDSSVSPVSDLHVAQGATTENSMTVTWTVPGQDGSPTKPASYDLRYSTIALSDGTWGAATQASGEPTPGSAGASQSMTLAGLTAGTTYYVAAKSVDAKGYTSALSNVVSATTVASANHAPQFQAIQDQSVLEGGTLTFVVNATDADGDSLTYSVADLPPQASFVAATRTFAWTPGTGQVGAYHVTFAASDGKATASQTITITVGRIPNRAPVLAAVADQSTTEESPLRFSLSATDPDGDPLTYSVTEGLPTGATFADRVFNWTPSLGQAGTYHVTFTVSDGQLTQSQTVAITVAAAPRDRTAPAVVQCVPAPDSIQAALNTLVCLRITDSDSGVDGNSVVIKINGAVVCQGNGGVFTSTYGRCSRSGTEKDYRFFFQSDRLFDFDQLITVAVDAADRAGNVMSECTYSFTTQMRAFGKNQSVSTIDSLADSGPATVCDSAGNIWVAWQDVSGSRAKAYVAKMAAGATTFGTPMRLSAKSSDQRHPDIAVTASGDVYAVWQDNRSGNWDIYASFRPGGGNLAAEVRVTRSNHNEINPAIVIDRQATPRVYITWQDDRNGNQDIYVASTQDTFATVTETRVTSSSADQTEPVITVDGGNAPYIFWTDARNGQADLYGATVSGVEGAQTWGNVPIVTGAGSQSNPAVAAAPNGTALHLLWVDNTAGNKDIRYAVLNGLPIASVAGASIVDDTSGADQTTPAVVCGADGEVLACWQDFRYAGAGGTDADLYAAELRSGTAGTNVFIGDDGTGSSQSEPAMGVDRFGQPYVVWTDSRGSATEIYYAATTLIDPTPIDSQLVVASVGATIGTPPAAIDGPEDVSVVVPAGACPVDTRISISRILNPPVSATTLLGGYDLGPSGIDFTIPVMVTIPYTVDGTTRSALPYWYDSVTAALSQQGITDVRNITISDKLNALQFRTTHFTAYYVIEAGADATSADNSASGGGGGCALASHRDPVNPLGFMLPYVAIAVAMAVWRRRDRKARLRWA